MALPTNTTSPPEKPNCVVVGHWEQSYCAPLTESAFWAYPLRDFGVTDWWMHPISGIKCLEPQVTLNERPTLPDIMEDLADRTFVFVEPPNKQFPMSMDPTWLADFVHPDDAVYIFGSAHFNPLAQMYDPKYDLHLAIETFGNRGVLWPHQVAVTVLRDRLVKSWQ